MNNQSTRNALSEVENLIIAITSWIFEYGENLSSRQCAHAQVNTKTTVLLEVVPERRTERFPPGFRPVGRFCEQRLKYLSSPRGREGGRKGGRER